MGPLVLDVKGKLSDLALTHLNPYMSQYLGWIARRGVLGLTFDYRIADDTLDARNEVVVGQPEIAPSRRGGAVRERIGVPLDTLVSLLKDSRGEVKMSVPVTGQVSSRQFDFGDAVWEGIRKTVINVLALPVSWIGKIFYTADARIDTIQIWPITFEPGTTQVRRDIAAQAERLATFLKDAAGRDPHAQAGRDGGGRRGARARRRPGSGSTPSRRSRARPSPRSPRACSRSARPAAPRRRRSTRSSTSWRRRKRCRTAPSPRSPRPAWTCCAVSSRRGAESIPTACTSARARCRWRHRGRGASSSRSSPDA